MKYVGMPFAVWQFFCRSFEKNLPVFLGFTEVDAKSTMQRQKKNTKK